MSRETLRKYRTVQLQLPEMRTQYVPIRTGTTSVEYGLVLTTVVVVAIAAVAVFGSRVAGVWQSTASQLEAGSRGLLDSPSLPPGNPAGGASPEEPNPSDGSSEDPGPGTNPPGPGDGERSGNPPPRDLVRPFPIGRPFPVPGRPGDYAPLPIFPVER